MLIVKLAFSLRQFTDSVGSLRSNQLSVSDITCPMIPSDHGYVLAHAAFIRGLEF
jgi:hypothetical protein